MSSDAAKEFLDSIKVDNGFNKSDDTPPFALWCPSMKGRLIWLCAEDEEGKITSVFQFSGNKSEPPGKQINYIENNECAKNMKNELMSKGWLILEPPKMVFKMGDETVEK